MRLRFASVVLACVVVAGPLGAAGGTIQDQAVSLEYPAVHWSSVAAANLLGTYSSPTSDPLSASGYWYRVIGVDTREHPLPAPDSESYAGGSHMSAQWTNLDGKGLHVEELTYVYDNERPSGTFTSELRFTNLTSSPISVEVFHYLDVDVLGNPDDDTVKSLTPTYLRFSDLSGTAIRYRAPGAAAFRVGAYPSVRDALNDSGITTFAGSGAPFGPGNATAAYQWQATIEPGQVRSIGSVSVSVRAPVDYVKGDLQAHNGYPALMFRRLSVPDQFFFWDMRRTEAWGAYGPLTLDPNVRIVGADDFDGDYHTDLVTHNAATGIAYVGGQAVTGVLPAPYHWRIEATGDFDYDGKPDILWRSFLTKKIVIWRMNGSTHLGDLVPVPDQATDANWSIKAALDFDNDGRRDLLWYNSSSGNAVIWHMDAQAHRIDGVFTTPASAGDSNWKIVAAGDYGKGPAISGGPAPVATAPDIVWRNSTSGKLVVWHMNFAAQRTAGVFTSPDGFGSNALDYEVVGPR